MLSSAVDYEEAKCLILHHTASTDDALDESTPCGFLQMLRPFGGLREDVYQDLYRAIQAIAPELRTAKHIERELVDALWAICWFGRYWGLHPDGMLRRNNLISGEDQETLQAWLDQISSTVAWLLMGEDDETAYAAP